MAKKYLSIEEAAAQIGVNATELNRLREKGMIRAFADRGTWKFKEEDVVTLKRSRPIRVRLNGVERSVASLIPLWVTWRGGPSHVTGSTSPEDRSKIDTARRPRPRHPCPRRHPQRPHLHPWLPIAASIAA